MHFSQVKQFGRKSETGLKYKVFESQEIKVLINFRDEVFCIVAFTFPVQQWKSAFLGILCPFSDQQTGGFFPSTRDDAFV